MESEIYRRKVKIKEKLTETIHMVLYLYIQAALCGRPLIVRDMFL